MVSLSRCDRLIAESMANTVAFLLAATVSPAAGVSTIALVPVVRRQATAAGLSSRYFAPDQPYPCRDPLYEFGGQSDTVARAPRGGARAADASSSREPRGQ